MKVFIVQRNVMGTIFLWVSLLFFLGVHSSSVAQVHHNHTAMQTASADITLTSGTTYEWTATSDNPNTFPVIHLIGIIGEMARAPTIVSSDIHSSSTKLQFTSPLTGGVRVLVRLANSGQGRVTVSQRETPLFSTANTIELITNAPVSGNLVPVNLAQGALSAVQSTGGLRRPVIYGLDKGDVFGRILQFSGFGDIEDPRILTLSFPTKIHKILVTSHLPSDNTCQVPGCSSQTRTVHIYENNYFVDSDADGLGDQLEQALGTCVNAQGNFCSTVANTSDTDGDGISDFQEVFGTSTIFGGDYVPIPMMGANPLHKDLFVEVDSLQPSDSIEFDFDDYLNLQKIFRNGSEGLLGNPDEIPGINVHFDVGRDPTPSQLATEPALATLFGDWGGSSSVSSANRNVFISSNRDKFFRYALQSKQSDSGVTKNGISFFTADDLEEFAHELGHQIGLSHYGSVNAGEINCKPNYASLMNYAYDGLARPEVFSRDQFNSTLNPASVSERVGIGSENAAILGNSRLPQSQADTLAIDWDFSGDIAVVRAPITMVRGNVCGTAWQNPQNLEQVDEELPAASPALVRHRDQLFVFWINIKNAIDYRLSIIGAADERGSCPISDQLSEPCSSWSMAKTIEPPGDAQSVDAIILGGKLVMLYRTSNNELRLGVANASGPTLSLEYTVNLGVTSLLEPELATIYYRSPSGRARVGGGVYYLNSNQEYEWILLRDPSMPDFVEHQGLVTNEAERAIGGVFAPAVHAWPDTSAGRTNGARNCMAAVGSSQSNSAQALEIYCDSDLSGTFSLEERIPLSSRWMSKPSLEFRLHRRPSGTPLDSENGKGNFWLAYNQLLGTAVPKVRTMVWISKPYNGSEVLRFGGSPNWAFNFGGRQALAIGSGVTLFMDLNTSAMKGAAVQPVSTIQDTTKSLGRYDLPNKSGVTFLPFADGTFRADLKDFNDWFELRKSLCTTTKNTHLCN